MEEISKIVFEVLKDHSLEWKNIEVDVNCSNAPAIKVTYKPKALRCNLIFGGCTAVPTSQFIESVLDKQQICKQPFIDPGAQASAFDRVVTEIRNWTW